MVRDLEREEGLGGLVRDERVEGGMGSRGEGRKGKVELPKEVRGKERKGLNRDGITKGLSLVTKSVFLSLLF